MNPRLAMILCAFVLSGTANADMTGSPGSDMKSQSEITAQKMADDLVALNPDLVDVIFHLSRPVKSKSDHAKNIVVAAHLRKAIGEDSDKDDLGVEKSGRPLVEVQKDGVRIGVLLPLKNVSKKTIGAIGLMYRYAKGEREAEFLVRAEKVRDEIAKQISSKEFLFADVKVPLVAESSRPVSSKSGRFDFMTFDSLRGRVLAAHKEAGTLEVFDVSKNEILSSIPVGEVQGVAVDLKNSLYFAGSAKQKKVSVINAGSLSVMGEVRVDGPVDAVAYDSKNQRIYAAEDDGRRVWVINPKALKVEATIQIPGTPEVLEYDEKTDRVYLNIKDKDLLVRIDPRSHEIDAQWSTLPAQAPHGLIVDSATGRAIVAGRNGKLVAVDLASGKVVGSSSVDNDVDQIAFDPQRKIVYSAAKGFIDATDISREPIKSLGRVPSFEGAHTIAEDSVSHSAWISYASPAGSFLQEFKPTSSVLPEARK